MIGSILNSFCAPLCLRFAYVWGGVYMHITPDQGGGLLPSRRLEGRKPDEIDLAPNRSFFSIDCGERLPCGAAGRRGAAPLTERGRQG